jgi:hypothetical protein
MVGKVEQMTDTSLGHKLVCHVLADTNRAGVAPSRMLLQIILDRRMGQAHCGIAAVNTVCVEDTVFGAGGDGDQDR